MENWIINPLGVVQEIFDKTIDINEVMAFFKAKLSSKTTLKLIPSINHCKLDKLVPDSLVRFRGMIQDMHDPEYYLSSYEVKDVRNQQISRKCGWFRDVIPYDPNIKVNVDTSREATDERLMYYCVPIPGETYWVDEIFSSECEASEATSSACISEQHAKRGHEECSRENPNSNNVERNGADTLASGEIAKESGVQVLQEMCNDAVHKKIRISQNEESSSKSDEPEGAHAESRANNSLPNSNRVACIVKIYDQRESYALNDCVDFIGVLSVHPALAYLTTNERESQSAFLNEEMEIEQCPPPSLVPRLHVICSSKMQHNNPLLPPIMSSDEGKTEVGHILNEARVTRSHLHAILEQCLLGDSLAADFLICHLVSEVYTRSEIVALGKFSLNLSNVPTGNDFTQRLFELLETITTKACLLPLSISNLNSTAFTPKKDYTANKLISGTLQLSGNTNLVVDETVLTNGKLESQGVRNMAALGNLISWQNVEYDFHFHTMKYAANVATLVLSEGKSLLASDCHVPLRPNVQPDNANFNAIATYLTPSLLREIRRYLTALKLVDYTISEEMQKVVQDDFVESRRAESPTMSADDLHLHLVLARLLSLSEGRTSLNRETWEKARRMELERKMRLSYTK